MNKSKVVAVMTTVGFSVLSCAGELVLAQKDVAPLADAVRFSCEPTESQRFAADELCEYARRIAGAGLCAPVVIENPDSALDLGDEGFRLYVSDGTLHVVGGKRGSIYGVYELLERFGGCGWFSPTIEVIPSSGRLTVPDDLDLTEKPAFAMRETCWCDVATCPSYAVRMRINSRVTPAIPERLGGVGYRFANGTSQGHTFHRQVPSSVYFKDHPEYFSERDGKRRGGSESQLCLTNPDVLKIVTDYVLKCLADDPSANMVGVSQNDNMLYCTCEKCRAVDEEEGAHSGAHLRFVNAVAEAVEKVRPDVLVETLIYQYSRPLPKITRPRANVVPCLCSIECQRHVPLADETCEANAKFMQDLRNWSKVSKNMLVWDYTTNFRNYAYPMPIEADLATNLRMFCDHGVTFMFPEGARHRFGAEFGHFKTYLLSKLMWNPNQDVDELTDRFFKGFYGAAAPFVREYYDRTRAEAANRMTPFGIFNASPPSWYTSAFSAWARGVFRRAAAAVRDDPVRLANVREAELTPIVIELDRNAKVAKTFFVTRHPERFPSFDAQAGDYAHVLQMMSDAKKSGEQLLLAAGLCWQPCKLADWGRTYGGTIDRTPRDVGEFGSGSFFIVSGRHVRSVQEDSCLDGCALSVLPSSSAMMVKLPFENVAFDSEADYEVSFRCKVEKVGGDGEAFRATMGVAGSRQVANLGEGESEGTQFASISRKVSETSGNWEWYSFPPMKLKANYAFLFGSGRWSQGGGAETTKRVLLDRICIRRVNAVPKPMSEKTEADLVIYGGTPAGLAAAVQAGRMGLSAILLEPTRKLGGLTTGGLGQTDIGNKAAFGGIARQFYKDVKSYYENDAAWSRQRRDEYKPHGQSAWERGEDSMWTFEPSAASAVIDRWVQKHHLDVRFGKHLDRRQGGVVKNVDRIVSLKTEDGQIYRGKMFLDCTYEGDLMAAAGVSYVIGREDNDVYGETINGIQRSLMKNHQIVAGVDPFVKKGDPASGLLPGVEHDCLESDGTGDKRIQAYCFRMCLTDDPENRIPFKKPNGYRELDYELLLRNFEAGENGMPWINSPMPNRKTDTNNRTGVSTDFIGGNWCYPEASYAEREEIARRHLTYQQGLMWTLANHPRVPIEIRKEVSRWGTCKDEFVGERGDGWQDQLYVREARRLVGECVMTEHHCRGEITVERPIALAAYGMDSHNVRRYVGTDGFVLNEGNIEDYNRHTPTSQEPFARLSPYGIDYGAIVPKRGECANLFVPVCLSASHMAFGSIRMEPVFFALGQASATAAAQSIRAKIPVQDLPYKILRNRLVADGQILTWK